MQIWLPESSIMASIERLDVDLLFQQTADAVRLYRGIEEDKDHPLVRQWRGHVPLLRLHAAMIVDFIRAVDPKFTRPGLNELLEGDGTVPSDPEWMGVEALHSSHRANLILRGERLAMRQRIKDRYQCSTRAANDWLEDTGFPHLHILRLDQLEFLNETFDNEGKVPRVANRYAEFGWKEKPSADVYWPGEE